MIVLFLLLRNMGKATLLAGLRLILAIASFIPLALFFVGIQISRSDLEITWGMGALIQFDYGFWASVLGFFGQLGGAIMDLKESPWTAAECASAWLRRCNATLSWPAPGC